MTGGHKTMPAWWVFVAARWKAIAALLVPLAGGLAALAPNSRAAEFVGVIVTALVTMGVVHQVPNVDVLSTVSDVATAVVGDVATVVGDEH